ncbi:MAG: aquaporin family protein [Nitrospinae bacterium]|nr:aquaporin family protein [Nitrospinota bacterium]
MSRKLLAEAIGTAFLLAAITGSGIMGDALSNGQAGAALLPHSLAIGAILFVMITLLGPVSGAHFNPAVTMVFALNGEMEQREAAPYVATQFLAGILGVLAAHLMFDLDIAQVSAKTRSGIGQWSAEVIATAGLIFVILGGLRTNPALIPAMVGLYIMAALWFTASTSFANPAVTIARVYTNTFSGIQPFDAPAFIIAQFLGALAGWRLACAVWPEER